MALHAILDDSIVADRKEAAVGLVFGNDKELQVVLDLISVARRLVEEIGIQGTFDDARVRPSWAAVVAAAKRAKSVLDECPRFP